MLVIHSMRGGGSERQMSYLANELAMRFETVLVTLDGDVSSSYELDPRIRRIGLGVLSSRGGLVRGAIANFHRIRAIAQAARDLRPDVVLSFCDTTNVLTGLACGGRYPVIVCERSDPRRQNLGWVWERLRDRAYPRSRVCISQTDEVGAFLSQRMGKRAERVQWITIPSAIEPPPDHETERQRGGPSSSLALRAGRGRGGRLIYVGRLSKEKRVDRLVSAWKELCHEFEDWELVLVGDGPERPALERLAHELELPRVVWRGWAKNVWGELASADVFCLTSDYEGFPQAMLEAMAAGVAVVSMDCSPAVRETIRNGFDGIVVPTESDLVPSLRIVLADEDFRNSLGSAAAQRAKVFYWSELRHAWLNAIDVAVGLASASRN